MQNLANSITIRTVTAEDKTFLVEVFKSSRGDDLRGLGWDEDRVKEFLELQYEAKQRLSDGEYDPEDEHVVMLDGAPIGHLIVNRRDREIRFIDLALLPQRRNAGIGTFLIRQLQDEAARANKPLRLQVIRYSRAVNLFERLGFARTSETGTHLQMEWLPR